VSGDWLALGAIGALALAGATKRGSRSTGAFRQIAPVPPGFTASPLPFVQDTILEPQDDYGDELGLFHVTTNLGGVAAQARLRSRRQLRALGVHGAGLGGGIRDLAADQVSVGISLNGALRVLQGTRMMAKAVHGQLDARTALHILDEISASPLRLIDEALDWMLDDPEERDSEAARAYDHERDQLRHEVLAATPGLDLYDALRAYETFLANTLIEWMGNHRIGEQDLQCGATVGFTEPAARFRRVQPDQVGLVQLAGRQTAITDLVPSECELRFRSDDLALIGIWEGA